MSLLCFAGFGGFPASPVLGGGAPRPIGWTEVPLHAAVESAVCANPKPVLPADPPSVRIRPSADKPEKYCHIRAALQLPGQLMRPSDVVGGQGNGCRARAVAELLAKLLPSHRPFGRTGHHGAEPFNATAVAHNDFDLSVGQLGCPVVAAIGHGDDLAGEP